MMGTAPHRRQGAGEVSRREFVSAGALAAAAVGLAAGAPGSFGQTGLGAKKMSKKGKRRRIIFNNDGGVLSAAVDHAGSMTAADLGRLVIEPLAGTHVDALFWCPGQTTFLYDTKVGQFFGENVREFKNPGHRRAYENTKALIAAGNDPPKVIVEQGHKARMEVFISFRMNDCHEGIPPLGSVIHRCKLKQDHPEYVLDKITSDKFPGYIPGYVPWSGLDDALNYAYPGVRQYYFGVIEEVCQLYDLDGVEMDFQRHPRFFKEKEVEKNRAVMTGFVRRVRKRMDEIGKAKGRRLSLAVRVPPSFDACLRLGLDVRTWLKEGWIDILTASTMDIIVDLPVQEFVEAARGTRCQVFACLSTMPWWHKVKDSYPSIEEFRAKALSYWRNGVDGIYLFNANYIATVGSDPATLRQALTEIGEPAVIAHKDKRYVVHHMVKAPRSHVAPPQQLPRTLAPGKAAEVTLDIGDDVPAAVKEKLLSATKLKLNVVNLAPQDEVAFELNGVGLPWQKALVTARGNDRRLQFTDIAQALRQGQNTLRVILTRRGGKAAAKPVLTDVEVVIRYNPS